ncbi:unnamed protein product [Adineta steineri]|uniref:Uncharacterized protein n=1 Tax=Adineta steineri TaxID=433720 RepID=A0A814X1D2_9BILA|nr:unnamed protein product [Adineta steineri]
MRQSDQFLSIKNGPELNNMLHGMVNQIDIILQLNIAASHTIPSSNHMASSDHMAPPPYQGLLNNRIYRSILDDMQKFP